MDELQKYYEYLKGKGADVPPTLESFRNTLSDETSGKQYHQYLKSKGFDAPDTYESFASTFGLKKKAVSEPLSTGSKTAPSGQTGGGDYFSPESRLGGKGIGGEAPVKPQQPRPLTFKEQSEKVRKEQGRTAQLLFDAGGMLGAIKAQTIQSTANIGADFLDFIGMVSNKIDDKLGIQSAPGTEQKDYGTTQAAQKIRSTVRELFPLDPDLQDKAVVQLAGAVPAMVTAIGTGGVAGGALVFGTTSGGAGFREAYDRMNDFKNLSVEENIQKYAQKPEDVELIRKHVEEVKKSPESAEDLSFSTGILNAGIGLTDLIPVGKYFKQLDKFTGGAVKKSVFGKAGSKIAQLLEGRAGQITRQTVEEATQEIFQTGLENLTAQATYDRTRKVIDGMEDAGTVGGMMGFLMEAALGHHRSRRGTFNDPKEEAINEAAIQSLEEQKAKIDENPEAVKPESKEKAELLSVLDSDVSDETRKVAAEKLEAMETTVPDNEPLRQKIKEQYNAKVEQIDADAAKAPESLKPDLEERKKQLLAELDEVLNQIGKPKTEAERLLEAESFPPSDKIMAQSDPNAYLQYVAQQAQGFGQDWSPVEGGGREQQMVEYGYSPKLIQEAKRMFPAKKLGQKPTVAKTETVAPTQTEKASTESDTQSGTKPTQQAQPVPEQVQKAEVSSRQKVNDLVDKVNSFNKLPKNDPTRSQQINQLKLEANELGYKFDERSGKVVNKDGNVVQKRSLDAPAKAAKDFDEASYSPETKSYVEAIKVNEDALTGLGVVGPDGRALSKTQLKAAVKAMRDGKPTIASKAVYDFIENSNGTFDLEDKITGKRMQVPASEYFNVFSDPVVPMTDAEIEQLEWEPDEDYFNFQSELYEQERISEQTEQSTEGSTTESQDKTSTGRTDTKADSGAKEKVGTKESVPLLKRIDEAVEAKGAEGREAREAVKEEFGKDQYEKALKVTKNFDSIIKQLEQQGKIKKICP